jgi:predicted AlkP superfamily phosphohydrolase/phosphomutase
VILDHYRQLDRYIGQMLDVIDKDTSVMVVSDHGAGPLYAEISINKWLQELELLVLKERPDWQDRYRQALRKVGVTRAGVIARIGWPLANRLKRILPEWTEKLLPWPHAQLIEQVDWSKTKAYSFGSIGQIHINLRGREPQGIVEPGTEYETLVDDIVKRLDELVNPRTGRQIKVDVFRREALYHGPYADQGPDLNLILDNMSCITHITLDAVRKDIIGPPADYETGTHRLNGMFTLWGPAIRRGEILQSASIIDVAPTALYLMGEGVPQDVDGRVLTGAFQPEFLAVHPVQGVEATSETTSVPDTPSWTPEEEEKLLQHLKDLGYLG